MLASDSDYLLGMWVHKKQTRHGLESGAASSCLMRSVSEACGGAAVVTNPNAQGIVTFLSAQINVLYHVKDVTVQWDAVVSTVGGNACGREVVVDTFFVAQLRSVFLFHWSANVGTGQCVFSCSVYFDLLVEACVFGFR